MPKHDTVNFVYFNPTTGITLKIIVSASYISSHISQSENSMSQHFYFLVRCWCTATANFRRSQCWGDQAPNQRWATESTTSNHFNPLCKTLFCTTDSNGIVESLHFSLGTQSSITELHLSQMFAALWACLLKIILDTYNFRGILNGILSFT